MCIRLSPDLEKIMLKLTIVVTLLTTSASLMAGESPAEHSNALRQYALKNYGDVTRGGVLVRTTLSCASCHSLERGETLVGPSLWDVGGRLSREQLIEQVLEPSSRARLVRVQLDPDELGRVVRLEREDADSLTVRDKQTGVISTIKKADLAGGVKPVPSDMPGNQADALTPEQFADLIEFLLAKKKS
jgi:putative heme-binding domain-containing protein